jgi:hypothetical protein
MIKVIRMGWKHAAGDRRQQKESCGMEGRNPLPIRGDRFANILYNGLKTNIN